MTSDDYDQYVQNDLEWFAKSLASSAMNHARNKNTILAIADAVKEVYPAADFHFTGASITGVKTFADMAVVIEALDMAGLASVDNWETKDFPENRNRDFVYKLPFGSHQFRVSLYAGEDAKCEIVEESRETIERVKYKLVCGE